MEYGSEKGGKGDGGIYLASRLGYFRKGGPFSGCLVLRCARSQAKQNEDCSPGEKLKK